MSPSVIRSDLPWRRLHCQRKFGCCLKRLDSCESTDCTILLRFHFLPTSETEIDYSSFICFVCMNSVLSLCLIYLYIHLLIHWFDWCFTSTPTQGYFRERDGGQHFVGRTAYSDPGGNPKAISKLLPHHPMNSWRGSQHELDGSHMDCIGERLLVHCATPARYPTEPWKPGIMISVTLLCIKNITK